MNRTPIAIALAVVGLLAAGAARAGSTTPAEAGAASTPSTETAAAPQSVESAPAAPTAPAAPVVDRARLSAMHKDIAVVVDEEKALIESLNARFLVATDHAQKIAIQKEIEAAKKNGMIAVFEIQLRYAEADGRTVVAEQLRTTIDAIRNPKTPKVAAP